MDWFAIPGLSIFHSRQINGMALFFQFASMVCFGITNVLWKPPLATLPVTILILVRTVLTSSFFLILILLNLYFQFDSLNSFYKPFGDLRFSDVAITVGICSINYWGLFFYNKSLSYTRTGVTIIISCIGTIVAILFSVFLYREAITQSQILIFILFIVGLWFLENLDSSFLKLKLSKGVVYALLSLLFWSTWPLYRIAFERVGILWFSLILECTVLMLTFLIICFSGELGQLVSYKLAVLKNAKWIIALGLLGFGGVLFTNLAISGQAVSSYAIFGLVQPLISLSFAAIFLRERLTKLQYVGITIILLVLLFK